MESKKTDGVAERNRGVNTEKNAKRYCVCFILKKPFLVLTPQKPQFDP
ncbi:hypothetical protein [Bacillus sp. FSL M8-0168]